MPARPTWYALRNAAHVHDWPAAGGLLTGEPDLVSARDSLGETVLHFLAVENNLEAVVWLHNQGFDIDSKNDFGTPIVFEVAELGYKDLLLWFISKGARMSATDSEGRTIHQYLEEYEKHEMSRFLKLHGA